MVLFIVGAVGIIAVCVLACFLPCYYTQGWGYARVGFATAYADGRTQNYSLMSEELSSWAFILIVIVIIVLVLYTILMLTNNSNIVPTFIIFVVAMAPFIAMLGIIGQLKNDGEFVKVGNITIGAGIKSGFTETGLTLCVLSIVFFIILAIGFKKNHQKLLEKSYTQDNKPKEIVVGSHATIPVNTNKESVKIFNDEYVDSYVYQADELIKDSFSLLSIFV